LQSGDTPFIVVTRRGDIESVKVFLEFAQSRDLLRGVLTTLDVCVPRVSIVS